MTIKAEYCEVCNGGNRSIEPIIYGPPKYCEVCNAREQEAIETYIKYLQSDLASDEERRVFMKRTITIVGGLFEPYEPHTLGLLDIDDETRDKLKAEIKKNREKKDVNS